MLIYVLTNHDIVITSNSIDIVPNNSMDGNVNATITALEKNQFDLLKIGFLEKQMKVTAAIAEVDGVEYDCPVLTLENENGITFKLNDRDGNEIFNKTERIESVKTN